MNLKAIIDEVRTKAGAEIPGCEVYFRANWPGHSYEVVTGETGVVIPHTIHSTDRLENLEVNMVQRNTNKGTLTLRRVFSRAFITHTPREVISHLLAAWKATNPEAAPR